MLTDFLGVRALGSGFMLDANNDAGSGGGTPANTEAETPDETDDGDAGESDKSSGNKKSANARIRELNKALKDRETELSNLQKFREETEAAAKKRADEEALAKGEHEKLLTQRTQELETVQTELKKYKALIKSYEEVISARYEETIQDLTEEQRDAIPGETILEKMRWVEKAKKAGMLSTGTQTPPPPNFNSRQQNSGSAATGTLDDPEYVKRIKSMFRM